MHENERFINGTDVLSIHSSVPFVPFIPHPMIPGGHLQTICSRLWNIPKVVPADEELLVALPDGDQVYFRINISEKRPKTAPVIALFHGLAGCSESDYNLRVALKASVEGYSVARFNHRGCGGRGRKLAKGIYHSSSYQDVFMALKVLSERFHDSPLLIVGFSISGTILLNLLARVQGLKQALPNLRGALIFCAPLDLEDSSRQLVRLHNLVYDQYFVYLLKRDIQSRRDFSRALADVKLPRLLSLRGFDELLTAPLGGFSSRLDYYQKSSPQQLLSQVEIPTLMVAAGDDPIVRVSTYHKVDPSGIVQKRIEESGGHMGFLSARKTRFGDYRWLDQTILDWVGGQV